MAQENNYTVNSTDCVIFPENSKYCDILVICKWTSSIVSIIGAVFTLGIIIIFRKYKVFTQRLIANLSFASMLFAISFLIAKDSSKSKYLCVFQGAFMTYIGWVIMLCAMLILLNLYCETIFQLDIRHYEKLFLAICWTVPLLFAGLPFIDDAYGPAGVWCWIKNEWGWRFGIWYIWKAISDFIFFVAVIHILYRMLRKTDERSLDITQARRREIHDDVKTLRMYPVVYFLVFLFPTVNRIYNAADANVSDQDYLFPLVLLHTLTAPLFGGLVALMFVLDKRTRKLLKDKGLLNEILKRWKGSDKIQEYPAQTGINNGNFQQTENEI